MRQIILLFIVIILLNKTELKSQWLPVAGMPGGEYSSIYNSNDTLYAGYVNKIFISTDTGKNWTQSNVIDYEVDFISAIFKENNTVFVGTYTKGIYKSNNLGGSWTAFNNGLSGILDIGAIVQRGDSIYAGTIGSSIYTTKIDDNSWSQFNTNIPMNYAGTVYSLYNFNGRLITGSGVNATIFYNDNNSKVWNEAQFAQFNPLGTAMLALNSMGNILYGAGSQGIYTSYDGGQNWQFFDPGVGYIEEASIIIYNGKVYVMLSKTGNTYFYTLDNTTNQWALFDHQTGNITYHFAICNNKIFVTRYDGLYYRELETTDVKEPGKILDQYSLLQNYPNPFNPTTTIQYVIPSGANKSREIATSQQYMTRNDNVQVTLKVYDVLGREVTTLVDEKKQPGNYRVNFDSSRLCSGTYFYKITAGDFTQTKKMMVLK